MRDEFCDYLEQEGIVSVHSVIELVDYSKGLSATAALRNIFDRVEQELKARDAEFETKSKWLGTSDTWPKLEIMHPAYERVFGEGSLFRIWVWFAVPGIWKADCHGFCIELQMWNRELKSNWDTTASRLPQWKSKLEQDPAGFVFEAEISSVEWRNYAEGKQLQFSSEPRRVLCYPKSAYDPKPVQDQFSSVDETVRWLVQEIWHVHDCILKL